MATTARPIRRNPRKKELLERILFPVVPASQLSLNEDFLNYEPESYEQQILKDGIEGAIKDGVKDFRRPIIDPSINEKGEIFFEFGNKPAVGKSILWWEKDAKKYKPSKHSRLGTLNEYYAFLGFLIKELIGNGLEKPEAWLAVCDDSRNLGHFCDSKNANDEFELTGNRKVGKWYDLGNTYKIFGNSKTGFLLESSSFESEYPIADVQPNFRHLNTPRYGGVGWIVLDK